MADQFPGSTKMVLSPAAQAIRNAFLKDADEDATLRLFQGHLAAAIRAAADQVVPHTAARTDRAANRRKIRAELLTIATELDPT